MHESFIQKLARTRADKIFTPEFYKTVTDSWYFDELLVFEKYQIGVGEKTRYPNRKEKDLYMKWMSDYFEEYKDKYYGGPLAQDAYGKCIDCIDKILKVIEYGNENYHLFEIDDETIKKIKDIGNIFVYKHNEFCEDGNSGENNK